MANEFDNLDEEAAPVVDVTNPTEGVISSTNSGLKYDWQTAPDRVKAPPRVDLNGKTVTIDSMELILPAISSPWLKTRKNDKDYKYCQFVLKYSEQGQQEFISGVRVFKTDDGKYSHPSFTRDRKTQASALLGLYADYKKKDINEVSIREFLGYLSSKPKVVLEATDVENPTTGAIIKKNLVKHFV